ncbi:hypothetical protein J2T56_002528 [Natronobacillus azotifigens]
MKSLSKRINWFQMNLSAWLVIIISYIIPFNFLEDGSATVGFPLPFLTIYIRNWSNDFSTFFNLNIAALFLDIIIVYLIITLIDKLYKKYRKRNHN